MASLLFSPPRTGGEQERDHADEHGGVLAAVFRREDWGFHATGECAMVDVLARYQAR